MKCFAKVINENVPLPMLYLQLLKKKTIFDNLNLQETKMILTKQTFELSETYNNKNSDKSEAVFSIHRDFSIRSYDAAQLFCINMTYGNFFLEISSMSQFFPILQSSNSRTAMIWYAIFVITK